MKKGRLFLTLMLFFLFYFHAFAQTPDKPIEILFVGDSFTHGKYPPVLQYNHDKVSDLNYGLDKNNPRFEKHPDEPGPWGGIPGLFAAFATKAGLNYKVSIEAVSARGLSFHADPTNQATPLIFQPKWDVIVLQDLSMGPLPPERRGKQDAFFNAVKALDQGIHKANPKAKIYLYQTWPLANEIYRDKGAYYQAPDALTSMTKDLYAGYAAGARINACCTVIPAGNAWLSAMQTNIAVNNPYLLSNPQNQMNLWGIDSKHPSVFGSYLSALVIFAKVTGFDPRQLGYEDAAKQLGITPEQASKLQGIAYQVIS